MTTFRIQKKNNYSIISNTHINDDRLSWKATAILTYLLSKPDDWTVHVKQLAKAKQCGIKAVYSGVKELKEMGYIEHVSIRDDKAKIVRWEYLVHEEPKTLETPVNIDSKLLTQKGKVGKGEVGNRHALLKTDRIPLPNTDFKTTTDYTSLPDPPPLQGADRPSSSSSHDLNDLLQSIPQEKRSKAVEKVIEKALLSLPVDEIKTAIGYALKHSKKNFKVFLAKTLENGWADGYEKEISASHVARLKEVDQAEEKAKAEIRAKHEALNNFQATNPEDYELMEQQAAKQLGFNLKRLKPGQSMRTKFKIMELMGI